MRAAFIVSAYRKPELLDALIQALGGRPVAVHVDKKSEFKTSLEQVVLDHNNAFLLKQHVCHWGGFGHVLASLEGLKWFLTSGSDYAFLLTGQCHPLYRIEDIEKALEIIGERSLMESEPFPRMRWLAYGERGGYERIEHHYRFEGGQLNKLSEVHPRRLPKRMYPFGGSGYWGMPLRHAAHVLNMVNRYPAIIKFFETVYIPDEIFFQTILSNSRYKQDIVNWSMHYLDWSGRGSNPGEIKLQHLASAVSKRKLFARKFDSVETMGLARDLAESRKVDFCGDWRHERYRVAAHPSTSLSAAGNRFIRRKLLNFADH